MLKIVTTPDASGGLRISLAGQVIGPWVEELRRSSGCWLGAGGPRSLDLGDVSFVDRAGVGLLRTLQEEGMVLENCSPFLVEQLKAQGCRR